MGEDAEVGDAAGVGWMLLVATDCLVELLITISLWLLPIVYLCVASFCSMLTTYYCKSSKVEKQAYTYIAFVSIQSESSS